MSSSWRTKADVLKDLGEVNGRRTGAEHLDQHVVAGERPPPIHHEAPDADEMSYFFGHGAAATGDRAEPDLDGISVMLQMVNDIDDTDDHEPMTLYRNGITDEIRISKLNPRAGEYVPGTTRYNTKNGPNYTSPKKRNTRSENHRATLNKHVEVSHSDTSLNGSKRNVLPVGNNMFKSKSDKVTTNGYKEATVLENRTPIANEHVQPKAEATQKTPDISLSKPTTLINGVPKRKIEKPVIDSCNVATSISENNRATLNKHVEVSVAIPNGAKKNVLPVRNNMFKSKSDKITTNGNKEATVLEIRTPNDNEHVQPKAEATQKTPDISLSKLTTLNGLPKRKIEKSAIDSCNVATNSEDIEEIKEKIKTTIIASSANSSLATKREKNVAIATLLKMGMLPKGEPVKLIKPEYFETPPSKEQDSESVSHEEVTKTSSESMAAENYIDQDSLSKVNGWFNSMESPKPKLLPQEPLTLKEDASLITFKKKTNSSVTSNSDTSKENKKEPAKAREVREVKAFKPSSYAMDLLKQYESNAQRAVTLTEDLGSRLERQLKERDEVIRQKLASQNAG